MGVTVKELRAMLAELPAEMDDHIVFVAADPEGNSFDSLAEMSVGWAEGEYRPDRVTSYFPVDDGTWAQAMADATREYFYGDEEEYDDSPPKFVQVTSGEHEPLDVGDAVPALTLWP